MAYVSQEMKAKLAPTIKAVLKKYGVKGTISVQNHMSLVVNIKSGSIDFIKNYNDTVSKQPGGFRNGGPAEKYLQVNHYWYHEHYSGVAKKFLGELIQAMKGPDFFDHTDAQIDYFHVSHYFDINIGRWNKPYEVI